MFFSFESDWAPNFLSQSCMLKVDSFLHHCQGKQSQTHSQNENCPQTFSRSRPKIWAGIARYEPDLFIDHGQEAKSGEGQSTIRKSKSVSTSALFQTLQ